MKTKIFYLFMTLFLLSSCYRSLGSSKLNKSEAKIVKEINSKNKEDIIQNYNEGFVNNFKLNNRDIYEFQYLKLSYNWLGIIPIIGMFTNNIETGKHLILYFDENNKLVEHKYIKY